MNILHLATVDNGGGAYFCADALNTHTEHKARAVRTYQGALAYPYDVLKPAEAELAALYEWADLVHVHDEAGGLLIERGWMKKPVVITWHGTRYRRYHAKFDARCEKRRWLVTVSTLDLTKWGAEWLPMPRANMLDRANLPPAPPLLRFYAVHAPTNRERKKTDLIVKALDGLVMLHLVEGVEFAQCLELKRKSHALIDGWHGYGNNSVEAWAMGMPTVSGGPAWLLTMMQKRWGYLPFAVMKPTRCGVLCPVARLVQEPEFYADVQRRGREHYLRYHEPSQVSARMCELYERAKAA